MKTKAMIITVIVFTLSLFVGVVGAQDDDNVPDRRPIRQMLGGEVIEIVTNATDLDVSEIREALQDGSTLADIISDSGADVDEITATVIETIRTAINERVASGDLTQEQADTILENLDGRLTDLMNGEFSLQGRIRGQRGRN